MSKNMLSQGERDALLKQARENVARAAGKTVQSVELPTVTAKAGAFVSLHRQGRLRGCIGSFDTSRPVCEVVGEMAVAASQRDPRFNPVTVDELDDLDIEISVLSPREPAGKIEEIEIGIHGLYITSGYRSGVLLPQVAVQYGWNREEFLANVCRKAGLDSDAWKDPGTRIEIFTAEVFGEGKEQ